MLGGARGRTEGEEKQEKGETKMRKRKQRERKAEKGIRLRRGIRDRNMKQRRRG